MTEWKWGKEFEGLNERSQVWWDCKKKGVTPMFLVYRPGTMSDYRAYFTFKFGENESREAAFTYLKTFFDAEEMFAFRHPSQGDNEFFVKFNIGKGKPIPPYL